MTWILAAMFVGAVCMWLWTDNDWAKDRERTERLVERLADAIESERLLRSELEVTARDLALFKTEALRLRGALPRDNFVDLTFERVVRGLPSGGDSA